MHQSASFAAILAIGSLLDALEVLASVAVEPLDVHKASVGGGPELGALEAGKRRAAPNEATPCIPRLLSIRTVSLRYTRFLPPGSASSTQAPASRSNRT